MPFIVCLPTFAVIDLFRLVYPAETDRAVVIPDLGLTACPAVGLEVITQSVRLCFHHYIGFTGTKIIGIF